MFQQIILLDYLTIIQLLKALMYSYAHLFLHILL